MRAFVLATLVLVVAACGDADPTFMKVCPAGDRFVYPVGDRVDATGCAAPAPLCWPGLPLRIAYALDDTVYNQSLDAASTSRYCDGSLGNRL